MQTQQGNRTITIRNIGTDPLSITSIVTENTLGISITPNAPLTIQPSTQIEVNITLTGIIGGSYQNTLTIVSNANNMPVLTVNMVAWIDPFRTVLFEETFDPVIGADWTITNSSHVNGWYVGTTPSNNDTNSIYISQNSGTAHTYAAAGTNRVHFWRDVAFPADIYGIQLKFDILCEGESQFDFVRVYLFETTHTPTGDTGWVTSGFASEPHHANSLGPNPAAEPWNIINGTESAGPLQVSGTSWTTLTFDLDDELAGQTKRLVFTWRNDNSIAHQPPAAIDNIRVLYAEPEGEPTPEPRNLVATLENEAVSLSWQAPDLDPNTHTAYRIYRNNTQLTQISGTLHTFNDNSVLSGSSYTYYITAVYSIGESVPSNSVIVTFDTPFEAEWISYYVKGYDVLLEWNNSSDDPNYTRIRRGDEGYSKESIVLRKGVDEIPELPLPRAWEGYRIYRDDTPLFTNPVATLRYTDSPGENDGDYEYGVQTIYTETSSNITHMPVTIRTHSLPFTENFEDLDLYRIYNGWTTFHGYLSNPTIIATTYSIWGVWYFANNYSNSQAAAASFYCDWLITPSINLGNVEREFSLVFDIAFTEFINHAPGVEIDPHDRFIILISYDNGVTWSSDNILLSWFGDQLRDIPYTGTTIETQFTGSGIIKIAFYAQGNPYNNIKMSIDNVLIDYYTRDDDQILPTMKTALLANYPNPFNPETFISFSLEKEENVLLEIYNIKGQKVRTLVNNVMNSGLHNISWKGTDQNSSPVSSGIYFYRMKTNEYTSVKRMMLIK